jgi:hypothetical protein
MGFENIQGFLPIGLKIHPRTIVAKIVVAVTTRFSVILLNDLKSTSVQVNRFS